MSLKIFRLFKILNPPLFSSPFDKGGGRWILICFILSAKKFIEKLMRVKENIKMDKSLYIDFRGYFLKIFLLATTTKNLFTNF